MAHYEGVRLRAHQQTDGYLKIAGMKKGAVTLYDVQVVARSTRRQRFRGTGYKIAHHRIDRDSLAGNHYAGLAGRAKIRGHSAPALFSIERERSVFLAAGAIGTDGQQPHSSSLEAGAHRSFAGGTHTSMRRAPPVCAAAANPESVDRRT
ncbi:MAG TPA: hypothetical protein VGD63_17155 [Steroidobacteraceae bacterium]